MSHEHKLSPRSHLTVKSGDNLQKQMLSAMLTRAAMISGLIRRYMQKLEDDKKMVRLRDIKKMNILDATGILKKPQDKWSIPGLNPATDEEAAVIKRLGWYAYVPCFEKGAIKFNTFRYVTFEILEINPEEQNIKIQITDYLKPHDGIWQKGTSATVVIEMAEISDDVPIDYHNVPYASIPLEDDGSSIERYICLRLDDRENYEDLYTIYSAKGLGWSKAEYKTWMDVVVQNSIDSTKYYKEQQEGHDQCEQLAMLFALIIVRCNILLEMNKPSRPVNTGTSSRHRKIVYEKGEAPERRIRNVGALRVQSKDVPKRPCMETVVTYKTAKWSVRGHIRHYKSGKEVYIKPSTRTRKALVDTDEATATTIRFKKKKES